MKSLLIAVIALAVPIHGLAGDVEVVFDMKTLGEESYCRKYTFDCFTGSKVSPDGKTVWISTTQALLQFTGGKRVEFRKEQFGAYCMNALPLAFDAKGTLWVALQCYTPNEDVTMATYDGSAWTLLGAANFPAPEYARRPRTMVFDKNNVMWATTYAGLVRYDGKEWKLYSTENAPLPDPDITALNVDKQGVLWMGTHFGNILKFDGARWEVFKQDYKSPIGLTSRSSPRSIRFDASGTMYFSYYHERGLKKFVGGVFKDVTCPGISGDQEDIAFDAQNVLWIANSDRRDMKEPGLLRYDGQTCKKFTFSNNWGTMLSIDAAGNKWVTTTAGAIAVVREGGVKLPQ
jgi:hypothetical protein